MKRKYLILSGKDFAGKTLSVCNSPNKLPTTYRISPIYSITDECFEVADQNPYCVGFIFCEHAFAEIGALLNSLAKEFHQYLWFSDGLASVIFIAPTNILSHITEAGINVRGYEIWEIDAADSINIEDQFLCAPESFVDTKFEIENSPKFDQDLQWVLNEFSHSIAAATCRAAQYAPSQLIVFERLVATVNSIVIQLKELLQRYDDLASKVGEDVVSAEVLLKKRFDFLASQLVQINSALSYIISQGFSGIMPLFESECHVRSYSLLGVGTAYRALSAFARHVEMVFEKYPVAETIIRNYGTAMAPAPGVPAINDPKLWDKLQYGINLHLKSVDFKTNDNPKLVFYSGRQGFRETKFTVSAPINTLCGGATVRWSMMTLSHELMHSHVMSILAAILGDFRLGTSTKFQELFKAFQDYRKSPSTKQINLKHCLAFIVFEYCLFMDGVAKRHMKGAKLNIPGAEVKDAESLRTLCADYFGEINEIIVHVLDYIYFYDRSDDLYVGLLWESWSPVPVVLEKIESYVLRTLLAVGSKEVGLPNERYFSAIKTVRRALTHLHTNNPKNIVIKHAINILDENNNTSSKLLLKFTGGIYLADFADHFLASSEINGKLVSDPLRTLVQEEDNYFHRMVLEIGQFEPTKIKSPVALFDDLLRKSLTGEINVDTEIATSWAYLACASFDFRGGDHV